MPSDNDNDSPARLYDLADALYRLAPWTWMNESQLIGLRHPDTGELGWMSMMGAAGNHTSLALYIGDTPLHHFNLVHDSAGLLTQDDSIRLILEARQLQVNFALRDELFKKELSEIKTLGRKYRGGNWPCFRSFHPGRSPSIATGAEKRWLACALEQLAFVAPRLQQDPFANLRIGSGSEGASVLTREYRDGAWHDTWAPEDRRVYQWPEPVPSEILAATTVRLSSLADVECVLQLVPATIGQSGDGVFPYLLLCVDHVSGFVFGFEMLSVEEQTFDDMIASVPDHLLKLFIRHGFRPATIRVASAANHALFTKTAAAIGAKLRCEPRLRALEQALHSAMGFMSGRMS